MPALEVERAAPREIRLVVAGRGSPAAIEQASARPVTNHHSLGAEQWAFEKPLWKAPKKPAESRHRAYLHSRIR